MRAVRSNETTLPVANEQSATEDALRIAVDTTPAFIHTARSDGYLNYFNRRNENQTLVPFRNQKASAA
jgi:hypothetical protein